MPRREARSPEAVYRALAPAVLGYFRAHRMDDPEALTGDVFVGVTQGLGRFRGDDRALRRWVFTLAHHRRVDAIRRSVRDPTARDVTPPATAVDDPEAFDPELVQALDRLTADQREVVVLRFVADLPIETVARLTGRSKGAVKMLQSRALDALHRDLGDRSSDHTG